MSTCEGQSLQSCLVLEPRVLRLKLAPSEPNIINSNSKSSDNNFGSGGWSFLQSLSKHKDEAAYLPPTSKRRSSVLSEKSLEMCTESLGSETGCDDMSQNYENHFQTSLKSSKLRGTTRMNRCSSFPPPLTSSSVQMRPRREGGRLVLEAVSVSNSPQSYFQAERIDGRLRLNLMKDSNLEEEEEEEDEEEEEEEEEEEGEAEERLDEIEEKKENSENGGGEMGMEKLTTLSRCKENGSGNKSLLNWEPFWVAT